MGPWVANLKCWNVILAKRGECAIALATTTMLAGGHCTKAGHQVELLLTACGSLRDVFTGTWPGEIRTDQLVHDQYHLSTYFEILTSAKRLNILVQVGWNIPRRRKNKKKNLEKIFMWNVSQTSLAFANPKCFLMRLLDCTPTAASKAFRPIIPSCPWTSAERHKLLHKHSLYTAQTARFLTVRNNNHKYP